MMQLYKYGLLSAVRKKSIIFWTLIFPVMLGTFFNAAFGNFTKITESFSSIPAAVAVESQNGGNSEYFLEMIDNLSQGGGAIIKPTYTDMKQAENLLSDGEIEGIFQVSGGEINLIVNKKGINQSILKSISDNYLQTAGTINNIAAKRPDMIEQTIKELSDSNKNRNKNKNKSNSEIYLGRGKTDTMVYYFYALLAMTCLYGSTFGHLKILGIQANLSPLAARRCVSPVKKSAVIISEFAAAVTIQFVISLIVAAYLMFVLRINFGDQSGFIILTSLTSSIMGVSLGIFVGAFIKGNENTMQSILTCVVLSLCFFGGLMIGSMKNIIEQNIPVINRINPAVMISDSFYSLSVYSTYSRYIYCMVSMLIASALFCAASAFVLGRKKYASI